jgi:predicted Zn-dependent peptidase
MVKKIVLDNGLRIVLASQPESMASTVLVLVEAGSEYETKNINGLSHFLEHLCFKGTVKRPRPGMIAEELDSLGSEYNAFTGQEFTGYWAKAEWHKLPHIIDLVGDLYLNPVFNVNEIERERGVVIEEINMYEDMPMRKVQDLFMELLYGDQPAGWDVAGSKEVLMKLTREDFIKYRGVHYCAPATVVVVAGKFKEDEVVKQIKDLFGDLPKKTKRKKPDTKEEQKKPEILVKFKKADQSHLVLGARAFGVMEKRRHAIDILADVLGGGMSSRLFRRIREELGAAYYVRSGVDLFLDHGYLSVSSGVNHPKIFEVIEAILAEFKRLTLEPVSAAELKKTKDHLLGGLVLGLETSDGLASFHGEQEILMGGPKELQKTMEKLQAVTSEEIMEVAKMIFKDSRLNLAVIGPYKSAASFKKILTLG